MVPVTLGYYVHSRQTYLLGARFWRLDPAHHYLPDAWMGLRIDCTGRHGLLGWTREQTVSRAH